MKRGSSLFLQRSRLDDCVWMDWCVCLWAVCAFIAVMHHYLKDCCHDIQSIHLSFIHSSIYHAFKALGMLVIPCHFRLHPEGGATPAASRGIINQPHTRLWAIQSCQLLCTSVGGSHSWRRTRFERSQETVYPAAKTTWTSLWLCCSRDNSVGLLVLSQPLGMWAKLHHDQQQFKRHIRDEIILRGRNRTRQAAGITLSLLPSCLPPSPPPPYISHVNSSQPTTSSPVSAPTSSPSLFTSNSLPFVLGNCVWRPRLGRFLQAWHFITAKDGTHGDLHSASCSHFRGPFTSCGKKEKEIRLFFSPYSYRMATILMTSISDTRGFFFPIMCRLCLFNIGASSLMTPIILICTWTQLGVARPSVLQ